MYLVHTIIWKLNRRRIPLRIIYLRVTIVFEWMNNINCTLLYYIYIYTHIYIIRFMHTTHANINLINKWKHTRQCMIVVYCDWPIFLALLFNQAYRRIHRIFDLHVLSASFEFLMDVKWYRTKNDNNCSSWDVSFWLEYFEYKNNVPNDVRLWILEWQQ